MNLSERFRPKEWADVVEQERAVGALRAEYAAGRRLAAEQRGLAASRIQAGGRSLLMGV